MFSRINGEGWGRQCGWRRDIDVGVRVGGFGRCESEGEDQREKTDLQRQRVTKVRRANGPKARAKGDGRWAKPKQGLKQRLRLSAKEPR